MHGLYTKRKPDPIDPDMQYLLDLIKSYGGLPDTPETRENPIGYMMAQLMPRNRYRKKRWTHPEKSYSRE